MLYPPRGYRRNTSKTHEWAKNLDANPQKVLDAIKNVANAITENP